MGKNSFLSLIVLTLSLSFISLGCQGTANQKTENKPTAERAPQKAEKGEIPDSLIIATGASSGTYYPLGAGMAQIFSEKAKIKASVQSTGASVENLRMIKDGQAELAFTQSDIANYASKGLLMFKDGGPIQNVKAIASLYNETVQVVVLKNSPIHSINDLKGKRVSVGAPGGATEANAMQLLEVYGLSFADLGKVEHYDIAEASTHLKDGSLDATLVTGSVPTTAVNELASSIGIRLLEIDEDHSRKLIQKYPYYSSQSLPKGTYPGMDQDEKMVGVKAQLVVRSEIDDTMVYNLTRALFENLDQLKKAHKKAEQIKLESALEGVGIEFHPGAAKYYQEKGMKK